MLYSKLSPALHAALRSRINNNSVLCYDIYMNPIIYNDPNTVNNTLIRIPPRMLKNYDKISFNLKSISNESLEISNLELRHKQKHIFNKILEIYNINESNKPLYISLVCPCGFGKTILSIAIINKLKFKCVIIAPMKFIVSQWVDKINIFNKDLKIYSSIDGIKKALKDIKNGLDCDIFICPDKHLQNDEIYNYIYENFSIIIIDEIHKYNLNNDILMTKFLYKNYFKMCLLLTATPADNMNLFVTHMIKANGEQNQTKNILVSVESKDINNSFSNNSINILLNRIKQDKFKEVYMKNYNYKMCISKDDMRNNCIVDIIHKCFHDDTKALILTDYRDHMIYLYNKLKSIINDSVYLYDVKQYKNSVSSLNEARNKNNFIIVSTIAACSESLDLQSLNTLHITLPITNNKTIIQAIGRIFRTNVKDDNKFVYYYNISFIDNIIRMFINDKYYNIKKQIDNDEDKKWIINKIYI
ncbi:ORF MSV148 putative DNA helicase (vaccinia A18R), similar to SW:P20534 [Melanoplus sanguinipes entomopoxvirus]|uniref:ORF MSV148 putative DNA helicase (Vaccinia A18R), similar to SW:P20534 n=1 Tax=Melanoplus sanguinipes entomopoxvirus TaxID=83191 RepID=Q9YVU4_MSEPV|nr:ORF MSV148 putative DNA helicase (vaccinia A18R), similar to SW:P20534 [Melanoplus sanguinipes entomopoxvirus]AAC97786.1 ORF MSV148 putative DNA helicase (vaccinia A18R), similar to SW:P20534 [Melanoplus sanguinipes entomopoxvirus 'O']